MRPKHSPVCTYVQTQGRNLDSYQGAGLDWIAAEMSPGSRNSGVVTLRFPGFQGFALPPLQSPRVSLCCWRPLSCRNPTFDPLRPQVYPWTAIAGLDWEILENALPSCPADFPKQHDLVPLANRPDGWLHQSQGTMNSDSDSDGRLMASCHRSLGVQGPSRTSTCSQRGPTW